MSPRTRLICALLLGMAGLWYLSMAWDALSRPQDQPLRIVGLKLDDAPEPEPVAVSDSAPPPAPRARGPRQPSTTRKEKP